MPSRFKQSLFFIKHMQHHDSYHILSDPEFEKLYIEKWDGFANYIKEQFPDLIDTREDFSRISLHENLYASFRFIYLVDSILDKMELNGISLDVSNELTVACSMLQTNSTNVFLSLDDDFSFSKKYMICGDMYTLANNMYRKMLSICSTQHVDSSEPISITRYDGILNRLRCKYIRSSLMVLKMFLVLVVLNISPLYAEGIHSVAGELIQILREVLFNKRIIQFVINGDFYGNSDKPHSTTRLYIYFAMGNSDRYCIRLDFPHQGEECIHLNLNQPGVKQSTGFPIGKNAKVISELKKLEYFDEIFYESDDLYWFRHDYAKEIKKHPDEYQKLEKLLHDQSHIKIESDGISKTSVTDFTMAFFEALNDYNIQPRMDGVTDNDRAYQYILFQDYIYDIELRLENVDLNRQLGIGDEAVLKERDLDTIANAVYDKFIEYIKEKFPYDETLLNLADADMEYSDFIGKCLDRLDEMC